MPVPAFSAAGPLFRRSSRQQPPDIRSGLCLRQPGIHRLPSPTGLWDALFVSRNEVRFLSRTARYGDGLGNAEMLTNQSCNARREHIGEIVRASGKDVQACAGQ